MAAILRTTKRISTLILIPTAAMLALIACQGSYRVIDRGPLPQSGTRIVLNSMLTIQPNSARVIIQNGEIKSKPNLYVPWCTFFVHRPRAGMNQAFEIQADDFLVDKSYRRHDYSAAVGSAPIQVATVTWDPEDGSEQSSITQSVYFEVSSDSQPQVRRIVCSIFADQTMYAYPSVEEIKTALGNVATIVEAGA
jgi:hypothetical protein